MFVRDGFVCFFICFIRKMAAGRTSFPVSLMLWVKTYTTSVYQINLHAVRPLAATVHVFPLSICHHRPFLGHCLLVARRQVPAVPQPAHDVHAGLRPQRSVLQETPVWRQPPHPSAHPGPHRRAQRSHCTPSTQHTQS